MKLINKLFLLSISALLISCAGITKIDKNPDAHEHHYSYIQTGEQHKGYCDISGCKHSLNYESHIMSTDYKSDETSHYKYCTICDYQMIKSNHTLSDWIYVRAATSEQSGLKEKKCTVCNKVVVSEEIPYISSHNHTYVDYSDSSSHWKQCTTCGEKTNIESHTYGNYLGNTNGHYRVCSICNYNEDIQSHTASDWIIDIQATELTNGLKHKECTICHETLQTESIVLVPTTKEVNIFAINDFHGECDKMAKTIGYLKQEDAKGNTLLLNSGDMFQGSMLSNSNYGQLLTECMNEANFDEFTFGNHDFDWGIDNLKAIVETGDMPFLGANIYKYDFNKKEFGDYADDIAQKYVIKTLENGLRVGIIGVIGEDQITSICSQHVQNIGFKAPTPIIKELSTYLRNTQGCDVIIVSAHCDADGLVGSSNVTKSDTNVVGVTGTNGLENYVNAVFLAHTHQQNEVLSCNGLPFIQAGAYGQQIANIKLKVDSNGVTCVNNQTINYSSSWPTDEACKNLINEAYDGIQDEASEVLVSNLDTSLGIYKMSNLVAHAMAEACLEAGYDIDIAITNSTRQTITRGTLTYEKLYDAVPFDNVVYIAEVSGSDIINQVGKEYIQMYRVNGNAFEKSYYKKYKIAIIDYLLLHTNSSRDYNYFSSFTKYSTPIELTKSGYSLYNYRFITRDFLRKNKSIVFSNYTALNERNDPSLLTSSVNF